MNNYNHEKTNLFKQVLCLYLNKCNDTITIIYMSNYVYIQLHEYLYLFIHTIF